MTVSVRLLCYCFFSHLNVPYRSLLNRADVCMQKSVKQSGCLHAHVDYGLLACFQ
uniref:Uncharacterized protein n=1 Tax=Anguilla anguilla TaxID=7936 RepID=A0A0E9XVH0_ANGAN